LSFKADNVHNGDIAVDLINFFKNKNRMLIPVTLVIKRMLMIRGLNSSYTGGLCSYGVVMLVQAMVDS